MESDVLSPPVQRSALGSPALAEPVTSLDGRSSKIARLREPAEVVAYITVIAMWGLYVLPAQGGWQPWVVPVACAVLLPCLVVLRPWRHCPAWFSLVVAAPAVAAVAVAALTPFGDAGPISISRWGYFAGLAIATGAFARTRPRRAVVVVLVLLVALHQYTDAWLAWWGGDDGVSRSMTGTIYSANPFGGMMLAFALAAGALVVLADRPLRRLGWVVAPLAATAVFLSAARAAILLLIIGALLLVVLGGRHAGVRGIGRAVGLATASVVVLILTTSSLFFGDSGGALSGVASKSKAGQSVESTSGVRLDFWSAAVDQFLEDPVIGGGVGSYVGDSRMRMAPGAQRSQFAHNEVLGSFAEGGLVLGLPVLAAVVTALALFMRPLLRVLRRGRRDIDSVACAFGLGGGALVAHSMLDFPLSFPAILGLLGVLAGGNLHAGKARAPVPRVPLAKASTLLALVAVVVCGGYVGWSHDRAGVSGRAQPWVADETGERLTVPLPGLRDARGDVLVAKRLADAPDASPAQLADAERSLAKLIPYDVSLRGTRSELLAAQGFEDAALDEARGLARDTHRVAPLMLVPLAERLSEAGRDNDAFDVLARESYLRAEEGGRISRQLVVLLEQAHRLAQPTQPGWACARVAMSAAGALPDRHPLMAVTAQVSTAAACEEWASRTAAILGDHA